MLALRRAAAHSTLIHHQTELCIPVDFTARLASQLADSVTLAAVSAIFPAVAAVGSPQAAPPERRRLMFRSLVHGRAQMAVLTE